MIKKMVSVIESEKLGNLLNELELAVGMLVDNDDVAKQITNIIERFDEVVC